MKLLICLLLVVGIVYGYKIITKKIYIWFSSYLFWVVKQRWIRKDIKKPVHIMFLISDHFEPGPNTDIVKEWVKKYPGIAQKHHDADGKAPRHTWFYPSEHAGERLEQLQILTELTARGFGEIELHLHHHNDTEETLRHKLQDAKYIFNKVGALVTVEGQIAFGFVHGNWALDNSIKIGNENLCGVNNELIILKEEGCYADFTFPAINTDAQPRKINSIYYATDNPSKPKSYNSGIDVTVNRADITGDLMIVQGPLTLNFNLINLKFTFYPKIENGGVEAGNSLSSATVDQWVKANIHVKGKPDWKFIKVHTHGALPDSMNIFLGDTMDQIYSYLETKYNDGVNYILHYVTAREAYNIIRAAEVGMSGDPNQYRDYLIKPYKNSM